jgi:hypothetical protein
LKTSKTVAIKTVDMDTREEKKSADEEEKMMIKLKGSSPYLMDLIDSFEEVCLFIYLFYICFVIYLLFYIFICQYTLF